jgi:hypothetical protein
MQGDSWTVTRLQISSSSLSDPDTVNHFTPPEHVSVLCRDMLHQDLGTDSTADAHRGNVVLDVKGRAGR